MVNVFPDPDKVDKAQTLMHDPDKVDKTQIQMHGKNETKLLLTGLSVAKYCGGVAMKGVLDQWQREPIKESLLRRAFGKDGVKSKCFGLFGVIARRNDDRAPIG